MCVKIHMQYRMIATDLLNAMLEILAVFEVICLQNLKFQNFLHFSFPWQRLPICKFWFLTVERILAHQCHAL